MTPFDLSVVISTVMQDFDYVRFEEEASTNNIAVKSTWEFCQLHLLWDVWLPDGTKRDVYFARKDNDKREGVPSGLGLEHVRQKKPIRLATYVLKLEPVKNES